MTTTQKFGNLLSAYKFINQDSLIQNCTSDGNHPAHDIYLRDIGMGIGNGYGQYRMSVTVEIGGTYYNFKKHSTDSQLYDAMKSSEYGSDEYESILTGIFEEVMQHNQDMLSEIESEIEESEEE